MCSRIILLCYRIFFIMQLNGVRVVILPPSLTPSLPTSLTHSLTQNQNIFYIQHNALLGYTAEWCEGYLTLPPHSLQLDQQFASGSGLVLCMLRLKKEAGHLIWLFPPSLSYWSVTVLYSQHYTISQWRHHRNHFKLPKFQSTWAMP